MADLIQFKSDTLANWTIANPILAKGELALIEDTGGYRVGDGVQHFLDLVAMVLAPEMLSVLLQSMGSSPAPPGDGKLLVFSKKTAGRNLLRVLGPSGLETALQPLLARNKVGYWCPQGNATTLPGVLGYTAPTIVGTATARNCTTTNTFQRMRRLGIVTSAAVGQLASYRVAAAQIAFGNGTEGGFFKVMRFGISDPGAVPTDARMFVGMRNVTAAPTNVEPNTLTNSIGVGHGAADTNLKIFYGGSTAQPPIDLGSNFPINNPNVDVYDLALFSPPGGEVYYEVTRLNTGHVASGYITGSASGIILPLWSTQLSYAVVYRTNNASAVAVGLDIMSDYIETDN